MSGSQNESLENLFAEMLPDVKPFSNQETVRHTRTSLDKEQARVRQQAASLTQSETDPLSESGIEYVDPFDMLSFQRPGIQHGVFRKLRLGHYPVEARLDLHRATIAEARQQLFQFTRDCIQANLRSVIVVHGMGRHTQPPAKMKSHVALWLKQIPEVMAYHSAVKPDGGSGALYVMLRKSEKAKQQNREIYAKRKSSG